MQHLRKLFLRLKNENLDGQFLKIVRKNGFVEVSLNKSRRKQAENKIDLLKFLVIRMKEKSGKVSHKKERIKEKIMFSD